MKDDELDEFLGHILLRVQWQKFTPRNKNKKSSSTKQTTTLGDPILKQYREGKISKSEICRYLNVDEKDLFKKLVEMGELFGD